jgi:hypothetical protein
MSNEMEMEDFYLDARRKLAVSEEQNELLREQNSRLTLALDEALAIVRKIHAERKADIAEGNEL